VGAHGPIMGTTPMDMGRARAIESCAAAIVAIAALLAGCAAPPPASPAAPAPAPAEEAQPVPAAPELSPAQAKAQAQKLALEAVDRLQNGDEAAARQLLSQAQALD